MAIVTRLTDNFINPAGLPTLLHGTGVGGNVGRWLFSDVGVDVGNNFNSLDSRPTGQFLTTTSPATQQPTLRTVGGINVGDFDGNDALGNIGSLGQNLTPYRSVAAVVRRPSVDSTNWVYLGGGTPTHYALGPTPTNTYGVSFVGGGSALGAAWADTLWHFIAWSGSATDQVAIFDANSYTNTGDVVSAATDLWVCYTGWAAVFGKAQIAEIITWPTALSIAQFALVRQAMKDRYGTALGL